MTCICHVTRAHAHTTLHTCLRMPKHTRKYLSFHNHLHIHHTERDNTHIKTQTNIHKYKLEGGSCCFPALHTYTHTHTHHVISSGVCNSTLLRLKGSPHYSPLSYVPIYHTLAHTTWTTRVHLHDTSYSRQYNYPTSQKHGYYCQWPSTTLTTRNSSHRGPSLLCPTKHTQTLQPHSRRQQPCRPTAGGNSEAQNTVLLRTAPRHTALL